MERFNFLIEMMSYSVKFPLSTRVLVERKLGFIIRNLSEEEYKKQIKVLTDVFKITGEYAKK